METNQQVTIESLKQQMGEYTKMTEQLPFAEFSDFYRQLIGFLQSDYHLLSVDDLVIAVAICRIVGTNARVRGIHSDPNKKKFIKIAEKSEFWRDAITARLKTEGVSEEDLAKREETLFE